MNLFVAGREPSCSHKARFFIILLSISATYVIGDMYSANLTSLLARPGRGECVQLIPSPIEAISIFSEKAISTLSQLEEAMLNRGYNLYVERHSSTYSLLEVRFTILKVAGCYCKCILERNRNLRKTLGHDDKETTIVSGGIRRRRRQVSS